MDLEHDLVDRERLRTLRNEAGAGLVRILGYFHEDGLKSVADIEGAMAHAAAAALVRPAHTLKGEALQFGADPLAHLAEEIELTARDCVEQQRTPSSLATIVPQLRPLFERTLVALAREVGTTMPVTAPAARQAFGRRTFGTAAR